MALFNNKKDDSRELMQKSAAKPSREAISSVISNEMHIQGEITFKGKARLDGVVEGNISGENLILSESGKVKGDLHLDSLVCHGTVEGNIDAKLVTVHSCAIIQGKLTAGNLTVEPGASLSGEISTAAPSSGAATVKSSAAGMAEDKEKENSDIE